MNRAQRLKGIAEDSSLKIQQIFDFPKEEQAQKLLDWLYNNDFRGYQDVKPVKLHGRWAVMLAVEYKHRADEVQTQTVKIRKEG